MAEPHDTRRSSPRAERGDRNRWASIIAVPLLVLTGCGQAANQPSTDPHLQALALVFVNYMNKHGGSFPENEQALKDYVAAAGKGWLEQAGVDPSEDVFVSSIDGQPLEFIYANESDQRAAQGVIGFQKTSVDGQRLVAFRDGSVRAVDDAEFARLTSKP